MVAVARVPIAKDEFGQYKTSTDADGKATIHVGKQEPSLLGDRAGAVFEVLTDDFVFSKVRDAASGRCDWVKNCPELKKHAEHGKYAMSVAGLGALPGKVVKAWGSVSKFLAEKTFAKGVAFSGALADAIVSTGRAVTFVGETVSKIKVSGIVTATFDKVRPVCVLVKRGALVAKACYLHASEVGKQKVKDMSRWERGFLVVQISSVVLPCIAALAAVVEQAHAKGAEFVSRGTVKLGLEIVGVVALISLVVTKVVEAYKRRQAERVDEGVYRQVTLPVQADDDADSVDGDAGGEGDPISKAGGSAEPEPEAAAASGEDAE